jgi:hypothetical protein
MTIQKSKTIFAIDLLLQKICISVNDDLREIIFSQESDKSL